MKTYICDRCGGILGNDPVDCLRLDIRAVSRDGKKGSKHLALAKHLCNGCADIVIAAAAEGAGHAMRLER